MVAMILAGGKSSRMGQNKAFLEFEGKTFVEYLVERIRPMVNEVVLVVDDRQKFLIRQEGVKIVEDRIKGGGPLVGLWTGLSQIQSGSSFVLSCDMPLVQTQQLETLSRHVSAKEEVVCFADGDNRLEPFPAIYNTTSLGKIYFLLKIGRFSMKDFFKVAVVKKIPLPLEASTDFFNVNTNEDYKTLLKGRKYFESLSFSS